MQKQDITATMLRDRAGEMLFERGRRYAADGRVRLQAADSTSVTAVVIGSERYDVEVATARRGLLASCTCPFAEEHGLCKHIVAAVLVWLDEDDDACADEEHADDEDDAGSVEDVGARATADEEALLRRHLASQPREHLLEELLGAARLDPLLWARLLVQAGATAESAYDEALLRRELVDAFHIDGFVGYREAGDYFWGISQALEEIDELTDQGFGAAAANLALYALGLAEEFGGHVDDSDGGLMAVIEQIEQIHLRAVQAAPPEPGVLAQMLVERAVTCPYDIFYGAATHYAPVLGPHGLATYRELVETRWQALPAGTDRFDGDRFVLSCLREQAAEAVGGADALIAVLSEDASGGLDHLRIARVLHREGREQEALDRISEGLECEDLHAHGLRELAASIHRAAGRVETAGKLLWQNVQERPGVRTYRELSAGTGEDFPRWRERALALLAERADGPGEGWGRQDGTDLVTVLLGEDEIDAAWDAAHRHGCRQDVWLRLARERAEQHPADAQAVLLREAERILEGGNRRAYRFAASVLREARALAERLEDRESFDQQVRRLREANRRRPALQDEFTRAGL